MDRRRLLGLGIGAVTVAATGAMTSGSPALAGPSGSGGPGPGEPGTGFALLGDTQIDVSLPERTEGVRWAYEQIAAADPEIVCHVGDIVEHGSVEEYDRSRPRWWCKRRPSRDPV